MTVRDPDLGEERLRGRRCLETLPRFLGARADEDESVIAHHLSWLFPGMDLPEQAAFRVTRDGDTEISDDADDLLEAVESELRRRRFGAVVRLEVASAISRALVARLSERLPVRQDSVYPIHGLLDLGDLMQLHELDRPDLKYEPWVPHTQRRLAKPKDGDLFGEIATATSSSSTRTTLSPAAKPRPSSGRGHRSARRRSRRPSTAPVTTRPWPRP